MNMTYYNTTQNGITSWKEFTGRPSTMDWLRSIPAMVLIFLIGLLGKRKERKPLKPMGYHSVYPPSYKCITPKLKTSREISEGVKSYSVGNRAENFNQFAVNVHNQLSV